MNGVVVECMTEDVVTATPTMTLKQVDELLVKNGITGLPVVDGEMLVGVISQSDIVRVLLDEQIEAQRVSDIYQSPFPIPIPALEHLALESRKIADHMVNLEVSEVMSPAPVTVSVDESIDAVGRLMIGNRIHRVLVTDRGRLVGIVSALDIVGTMLDPVDD
ncbi:MAG: CBS domain-containing protein [Acidimicrobiia bacterium]|nr:CBS domain-containing protein [Acidimicrobiia bacterium]